MRTLLLVSALAALAACSDTQQTTAPASRSGRAASGDVATAGRTAVSPDAKPVSGQSGFTTVTQVVSNEIALDAGAAIAGSAVCPAGSTLVGGGFTFVSEGNPNARPFVRESHPLSNGWFVSVANWATGAYYASFKAYALCAS